LDRANRFYWLNRLDRQHRLDRLHRMNGGFGGAGSIGRIGSIGCGRDGPDRADRQDGPDRRIGNGVIGPMGQLTDCSERGDSTGLIGAGSGWIGNGVIVAAADGSGTA